MLNKKWWEKSVVYQIYPKSFYDSNNDGIGDIKGIVSKLPYLKSLGIDIIWLSPVYKSPMDDNGYDISDYYDIEKQFGSMEDMHLLIEEAEKLNIKIIMDLVINHTSDEHAWFIESKSSKHSCKRDYYIWRDAKEDGSEPNNWESIFGGSAWKYDTSTNQYYLHIFSEKQPDLNWENPKVREELYKMVNYWLDKGIGGFRVDAITYIKKGNDYKDLKSQKNEKLVHINGACLNQVGIESYLQELKDNTFSKYDVITVAEAPGVPTEKLSNYAGDKGFFNLLFEFDHVDLDLTSEGKWYKNKPWSLMDFKKAINKSQEIYNEIGFGALYIENHDQPRSLNKFIKEEDIGVVSAKMLAVTYFFLKGIPFIYQGQEIAMTNVKYKSIDDYDDIASIGQYRDALREGLSEEEALAALHRRSRDNARTPMQWDTRENAGFTKGSPWIKVNDNYKEINVEAALKGRNSLLNFYKELIKIRKESKYSDIIVYGKYTKFLENHEQVFGYKREYQGERILVVANFSKNNMEIHIDENIKKLIVSNYENINLSENKLDLRPYEAMVLELK